MSHEALLEELAALEHRQWAHWTNYMLCVLAPLLCLADDADVPEPGTPEANALDALVRWRRQIATPYAELSESERESDREWAREVLAIVGDAS